MDYCRNVSVSGEYQPEQVLSSPCSKLGATFASTPTLDDLFPAQNTEVDVSLEWLSIFVEDCLSSTGNCMPVTAAAAASTTGVENKSITTAIKPAKTLQHKPQQTQIPPSLQKFVVPSKARSKRKRTAAAITKVNPFSSWSYQLNSHNQNSLQSTSSDPPLLQQTYWLADSELIVPKKEHDTSSNSSSQKEPKKEEMKEETTLMVVVGSKESSGSPESNNGQMMQQQPRRCSHCLAQKTPQWRAGPLGPKTLCNACGVRYKSGRLLPEYRPAKSPTFVSYLHSNSHKKVMEMRMGLLSSISSEH